MLDLALPGRRRPAAAVGRGDRRRARRRRRSARCRPAGSGRCGWTTTALVVGRGAGAAGRRRRARTCAQVDAGVDAGAPVLGGGWSLPRGRTGLPLRLDRRPHRAGAHPGPGRAAPRCCRASETPDGHLRFAGDTGLVTSLDSSPYTYEAPVSAELFDRGRAITPGGVNSPVRAFRRRRRHPPLHGRGLRPVDHRRRRPALRRPGRLLGAADPRATRTPPSSRRSPPPPGAGCPSARPPRASSTWPRRSATGWPPWSGCGWSTPAPRPCCRPCGWPAAPPAGRWS